MSVGSAEKGAVNGLKLVWRGPNDEGGWVGDTWRQDSDGLLEGDKRIL